MNATRVSVNVSLATAVAIMTGVFVCLAPSDASAQLTYIFSNGPSGWRYMGLYDDGGLTPLDDFRINENPWTDIDGDHGAIMMGQEGFTPQSPTDKFWLHGDLNSPKLAYNVGRTFAIRFDVTGSHMQSDSRVVIQAVLVVRRPNDGSDRRVGSVFYEVPLDDNGAWDTHVFSPELPGGTIVKQINLRIFVETASYYKGWIMVDNVEIR